MILTCVLSRSVSEFSRRVGQCRVTLPQIRFRDERECLFQAHSLSYQWSIPIPFLLPGQSRFYSNFLPTPIGYSLPRSLPYYSISSHLLLFCTDIMKQITCKLITSKQLKIKFKIGAYKCENWVTFLQYRSLFNSMRTT